jgi:hypothetical protein
VTRADEGAIAVFRERFAQIMVAYGMPRMASRVYAALLVSDEHTWSHFVSQSEPMLVRVQVGADEGIALLGLDSPRRD